MEPSKDLVPRPAMPLVVHEPEQQFRSETGWLVGSLVGLARFVRRNWVELAPLGLFASVLMIGKYAARLPQQSLLVFAVVAVANVLVHLKYAERWWRSDDHRKFVRSAAGFLGVWLLWRAYSPVYNPAMMEVLAAGVGGLGYFWLRAKSRLWPRKEQPPAPPLVVDEPEIDHVLEHWRRVWSGAAPALSAEGSAVLRVDVHSPTFRTLVIQVPPRFSGWFDPRHVERAVRIDGRALPVGSVRVNEETTDASVYYIHIREINPLKEVIAWDPSLAPRRFVEPMFFGYNELGDPILQSFYGFQVLFGGASGAGKSNLLHVVMMNLASMIDVDVYGIDLKGGMALRPWKPILKGLATTDDEAHEMVRYMRYGVIDYRANNSRTCEECAEELLQLPGIDDIEDKIVPCVHQKAKILIVDEAAELIGDRNPDNKARNGPLMESNTSLGRGVAQVNIFATQYCSLESLFSGGLRANIKVNFALGNRDPDAGQFLLGKDAWGAMDTSRFDQPGMFFLRVDKNDPTPARAPRIITPQAREQALRYAYLHGGVDLHPKAERMDQPAQEPTPQTYEPKREAETPEEAAERLIKEVYGDEPTTQDVGVTDIREYASTHNGTMTETAQAALDEADQKLVAAIREAGPRGVRPKELSELVGFGRNWVHRRLSALERRNAVRRARSGIWVMVEGADLEGALAQWREAERANWAAR